MSKIKKYLPDALILFGVWLLSYNLLREPVTIGGIKLNPSFFSNRATDYHTEWKVFGILLIALGIDVILRRYLKKK